jgi:hypothetical protein
VLSNTKQPAGHPPARSPELPATRKPRFLMMKLLPMKMLLLIASASPMLCSFMMLVWMCY